MEPYYVAWEESSHHDVTCVECHYPPGFKAEIEGKLDAINQLVAYSTGRIGTKFHAEIPDESCLRSGCHSERIDISTEEYQRGIVFDHSHHYGKPVRDIELRCTSCHSQIVQGSHISVTPDTCFICHFRNKFEEEASSSRDFCLMCHDFPKKMVTAGLINYDHADYLVREEVLCWQCHSDVVRGNAEVESRACLQCHDLPDQLNRITEVEEVHANHVTKHKVECFNCHANIEHSVPDVLDVESTTAVPNCATCHGGLHNAQALIYAGTGGRGVEDYPSSMYQVQVDCGGCHQYGIAHVEVTRKETLLDDPASGSFKIEDSCVACHGEFGKQYLKNWQQTLASEIQSTTALVDKSKRLLELEDEADVSPLILKQNDAEYNLKLVVYGKGEHNIVYALRLMSAASSNANEIISELGQ